MISLQFWVLDFCALKNGRTINVRGTKTEIEINLFGALLLKYTAKTSVTIS